MWIIWNVTGILVCRVPDFPLGPVGAGSVGIWSPPLRNTWIPWWLCPGLVEEANLQEFFLPSHFPSRFYFVLSRAGAFSVAECPTCVNPCPFIPGCGNISCFSLFPTPPSLSELVLLPEFFSPQCCVIEFREFSPPADLILLVLLLCRAWLELRNVWDGRWSDPGFNGSRSLAWSEFSFHIKNDINPAQREGNKRDLKLRSLQNPNGTDREVIPKLSREMGALCSTGRVRNGWVCVFSVCPGQRPRSQTVLEFIFQTFCSVFINI